MLARMAISVPVCKMQSVQTASKQSAEPSKLGQVRAYKLDAENNPVTGFDAYITQSLSANVTPIERKHLTNLVRVDFVAAQRGLGSESAGRNFFSYDRVFGGAELSGTDKKNLAIGKETSVDKTLRLLYVTCSRAEESLALALWSSNPQAAFKCILGSGCFAEDEIYQIRQTINCLWPDISVWRFSVCAKKGYGPASREIVNVSAAQPRIQQITEHGRSKQMSEAKYFVYIYRDSDGNPVYVGQGERIERALSHEAGAKNPAFRQWLAENERTSKIEFIGPLGSKPMADAVETAVISACKPASGVNLFNLAPGVSKYAFRPLGVPLELAERMTQAFGLKDLRNLVDRIGHIMFVLVNNKRIDDDPNELRREGFDLAAPLNVDQLRARIKGDWQVDNKRGMWAQNPHLVPALLVGVTGGPGNQSIIGSLRIDPGALPGAEGLAGGLLSMPLMDDDVDAYQLRGRPILSEVGLKFGRGRYEHFRLTTDNLAGKAF